MTFRSAIEASAHPHVLGNYARAPVTFVRGEGCWLIDEGGERYLDCVAGIAVCALGHAHPHIAEAVARQAARLVHCSNLYHHEPSGALATRLAALSGFERVFFCNSGTEANEAAIKLARKLAWRNGEPERNVIVACTGSFHGRTLGALAATANAAYHEGFGPLPAGFDFVEFNDVAALDAAIDERTAAFFVEPVQGESGVIPASHAFLRAARRLCDDRGALLVFDEIQCGMGRLGSLFAFETFDVRPHLVTLAKALANGLPIGAMLVDGSAEGGLQPGDHGSTFGGSPIPCAAALAHLDARERLRLDRHVLHAGTRLRDGLSTLAQDFPELLGEPRGIGLMLGVPIRPPYVAKDVVSAALARHLLVNAAGGNTVRFVPPLLINDAEIDEALESLRSALRDCT